LLELFACKWGQNLEGRKEGRDIGSQVISGGINVYLSGHRVGSFGVMSWGWSKLEYSQ
jgi:hypothetical protein